MTTGSTSSQTRRPGPKGVSTKGVSMKRSNLLVLRTCTIAAKMITKNTLQKKRFGAINFVKITKQSLYKTKSLACPLTNSNRPVAVRLQRTCSGGIIFVTITKMITKENVTRNYFVTVSARMVYSSFEEIFSEIALSICTLL